MVELFDATKEFYVVDDDDNLVLDEHGNPEMKMIQITDTISKIGLLKLRRREAQEREAEKEKFDYEIRGGGVAVTGPNAEEERRARAELWQEEKKGWFQNL